MVVVGVVVIIVFVFVIAVIVIVIFVVVVLLDLLSMFIRSFVNEGDDVKRPSWKTIFQSPNDVLNQDKSNKE